MCVVTYRNTAERIVPALRSHDHLFVRDNTHDNVGFGKAANELATKGTDPLILFVNPDGDPQRGCFDALEKYMAHPDVVAVEASQGAPFATFSPDRLTWACAACLVVRRHVFEAVCGFDETLFLYCEDVDLSWKLAAHGRIGHCDEAVFLHDTNRRGPRAAYYIWRNTVIVSRRWGKPLQLSREFRDVAAYIFRGRFGHAGVKAAALLVGLSKS